jgi:hypothetical protein
MFVLGPEDKIRGDASAATAVDYVICGFLGGEAKLLADGQFPATTGDLYTAPVSGSYPAGGVIVKTISLVNVDSAKRNINLYILPNGGTARRIAPKDLGIKVGDQFLYDS